MQRRPPGHPVPRGLVWTLLPRGAHPRGAPNFEYRYRTPAFPEGISPLLVTGLAREEQEALSEHWFRLNFVPFEGSMGGAGYNTASPSAGGYGSKDMLPGTYLNDEFDSVLQPAVIETVSAKLMREATWWTPVLPEEPSSDGRELAEAAYVALKRVRTDLSQGGLGHNQGPRLDPAIVAEIQEQVRLGLEAVDTGHAGRDAGQSSASGLLTVAGTIAASFAQGVAKKAGEDVEPFIKHGLAALLDHMLQAAAALMHWVASIPPGPFL